jgi:hypothetical protein
MAAPSIASRPRAAAPANSAARQSTKPSQKGNVTSSSSPLARPPRAAAAAPAAATAPPAAPAGSGSEWHSAQGIKPPRHGKHFLHLDDFSKRELESMLALARDAKRRLYGREHSFQPFKGMSLAMIFTKPSARTRVSFETVRSS